MEHFKGFSLFNDVEDIGAQAFNRARILTNIVLDNSKDGQFSLKGVALSSGYMQAIPNGERRLVVDEFIRLMKENGFEINGDPSEAVEEIVND